MEEKREKLMEMMELYRLYGVQRNAGLTNKDVDHIGDGLADLFNKKSKGFCQIL